MPRSLSLWCEKGSGENIWDIKKTLAFQQQ
jgi:hypothetical protein